MIYHILVNPNARRGQGRRVFREIEPVLKQSGVDYQVVFSKSSGHIAQVTGKLTSHKDIRLIVIGGDGTLNGVVDSIADFGNVRLGYIPAGSGNDFWRSLQIPSEPVTLLRTILRDEIVRALDIGTLTYLSRMAPADKDDDKPVPETTRFCVSAGIGFDAAVCEGVSRDGAGKRILTRMGLAKLSYIFVALKLIAGNKNIAMDFRTDDGEPIHLDRAMFLAAMNTRYEGGGFLFAPDADTADGLLDLCVVGDVSVPRFLRSFPLAYRGKHFALKGVDHYLASEVEIKTAEPMWVHTDGEVRVKSDHILITCGKRKLRMLM